MAALPQVSLEEYLRTERQLDCDSVHGVPMIRVIDPRGRQAFVVTHGNPARRQVDELCRDELCRKGVSVRLEEILPD